ncbi:MAG TPA: hypothetical protein VII45_01195 [Solirubrobacterales bacterium]
MSRLIAYFLVCALGAGAAIALVSCGGGGSPDLLPGNTAREISENLDSVEQLASAGDCAGAEGAAQEVGDQIDELGNVDKTLKAALRKGASRLNEVVAADCSPETTESIGTAEIPATTESSTTEQTKRRPKKPTTVEPNTTPTTTPTTAPTTPATTPTTPTTPSTTPTPPPAEGGGTETPSGGVGPGAAVGEGG